LSSLNPIGSPFIELHTVDSTNNYAMGLVHAGMAQHGTSVFAHEQTKGRGQRNKQWLSETNSNIALSIIFEPQEWSTSQLFILSKLVSTGVLHFFNSYTTGGVTIKWPNDIYWCDRKAGGILIENIIQGSEWKYSVAGIGLNINQTDFKKLKNKAVSLRQITGSSFDPSSLAKELCIYLDMQFNKLLANPNEVSEQYHANLFQLGKKVKLKKGSRLFEAVIKDVTSLGQLVVQHAVEERFEVGEVEWVI
jgi:BirA family transcriptional regulator, biotin operon repressor / biotin---[acetyl-CoA-carboxylase] ligase